MLKLDFLARLSKKLTPAKCFFLATKGSKAAAASYGSSQKFSTRVFFSGSPAPRYTWLFIIHDATDKFVFLGWPCRAFFKFRKKNRPLVIRTSSHASPTRRPIAYVFAPDLSGRGQRTVGRFFFPSADSKSCRREFFSRFRRLSHGPAVLLSCITCPRYVCV